MGFMFVLQAQDPEFFPGTVKKESASFYTRSLLEGDRARGAAAVGMQQGAAVKGDVPGEVKTELPERSEVSRTSGGPGGMGWELQGTLGHLSY